MVSKKSLLFLLCIVFIPIGIYAVWKNSLNSIGLKISVTLLYALLVIVNITTSGKKNDPKAETIKKLQPINIDSLITIVKNDKQFEIKDVYYNKLDSSFNIALTNKKNVFTEIKKVGLYINKTYNIDSFSCFDGVYLYAYKKGRSLKNGDYKEYLIGESKRAGKLMDIFNTRYCVNGIECTVLSRVIKKQLYNPDSYESQKINVIWDEAKKFKVTNEFMEKNSFGVKVLNVCTAVVDIDGNVYDLKLNE